MRLIRHDLVRRLVAALLVVAMGGALVPAATAQGVALRTVLVDEDAVERALEAARAADPADRIAAFAAAYAADVEGVTAEAVERLLGQPSMSGVRPPAADEARATAPAGPTASASVVAFAASAAAAPPPADAIGGGDEARLPVLDAAPSTRPRAP